MPPKGSGASSGKSGGVSSVPLSSSIPSSLPPGPRSACGDQFGILGLVPVVQHTVAGGSEGSQLSPGQQNFLNLSRGFDLGNLGLSLVSPDPLHTTFSSPWLDAPARVQPDYRIPSCYSVNSPHLHYSMFQKFQDETLFYIFYSMPRDVLQLAAAQELYTREWRFHKQMYQWLTRYPQIEPTIKHQQYEKGTYLVFNPTTWQKERRDDFFLQYDLLEEKAKPVGSHPSQAQQAHAPPQATPS